jgi:hypothetical protein
VNDALTTLAIVGTARGGEPSSVDDRRADAVIAGLSELPYEARLLLAAGARAVASLAGATARRDLETPPTAGRETSPPCSAGLDAVLGAAIDADEEPLLLEVLQAIATLGARVPTRRLVDATRLRGDEVRRAFAAVAGARGAWLGATYAPLAWLAAEVAPSLDAHERVFAEGKTAARVAALEAARAIDAARARAWLEATWGDEKADARASLLDALQIGASAADEPFLEAALGDRSQGGRERAAAALARLPESAFARRMRVRADALFVLRVDGDATTIDTRWPARWERDDVRDGLVPSLNAGETARAGYAAKVAGALPLSDWRARFALEPAAIVEAGRDASGLVPGLASAAIVARDAEWLGALVRHAWSLDPAREERRALTQWTASLLAALPPDRAPVEALAQLRGRSVLSHHEIYMALSAWDHALGARFVEELRSGLLERRYDLIPTLERAAHRLPASCFAAALAPLTLEGAQDWQLRPYDRFQQIVRLRSTIAEELATATTTA